ncbi:MAG TPA: alkaline phosphatase family protein [Candidatus Binatia bacterium]|nr:alkaline phosphatase family protein [Candidatus Binatia bacterium]
MPTPHLPEGTDTLPQIEHIIIVMMENHSFDNYFGLLDPAVGLPLDGTGRPAASNPDGDGNLIHAFHMPSACQLDGHPGQNWNASHVSYNTGRNDGFVLASGPVAMGYWTGDDLPFYYGLARTFSLASRWFGSTLCQTYPNRRFLMAGTAAGIISTSSAAIQAPPPPNGNIFERLDAFGISWRNYHTDLPSLAILINYTVKNLSKLLPIAQFFHDAAAGTLPAVSLVDPGFETGGSEENPDDIRIGERFAAQVINAAMSGPGWPKTLLVWLYDEHGGYYDHVPPPPAIKPDDIPPDLAPGDYPGGYDRYGFRVPAVIVSPYARRNYVSSVVRDHTAVLKFIERKWNLGALTFRDANADDLFDCLDFVNPPAFLDPPALPAPALDGDDPPACTPGDSGQIPPPDAVSPAPATMSVSGPAAGASDARETRMSGPLAEVWAPFRSAVMTPR